MAEVARLLLIPLKHQEVLRLHPGLPMSDRIAAQDCVLPLTEPIMTTSGQKITELPISKGQHIIVGTASYNRYYRSSCKLTVSDVCSRLHAVWGPDADEFKHSRWLNGDPAKAIAFGPYAGL